MTENQTDFEIDVIDKEIQTYQNQIKGKYALIDHYRRGINPQYDALIETLEEQIDTLRSVRKALQIGLDCLVDEKQRGDLGI